MVLQQLVEVGHVKITDCLLDDNSVVMRVGHRLHRHLAAWLRGCVAAWLRGCHCLYTQVTM